ncbi:hypothetical protein AEST_20510 [Alishewanella aestuarii B11]|uniref:Uncharacterized protein n=1 Tax=Alishewanella aestuarii B11 TaxID=1197174 RepID=J2IE38_9ALTE|nr:hypothetical protein AEST_20510 [Alishewanella aestuarii B11]
MFAFCTATSLSGCENLSQFYYSGEYKQGKSRLDQRLKFQISG